MTEKAPTTVDLPAPTFSPVLLALGMTLMFAGIVTHYIVTVVGAGLALAGVLGWCRDVFPHERLETVRVEPAAIETVPSAEALEPGRGGHRARLPVLIHPYRAGVRGGLLGAVSMAAVAMLYGLVARGSIWFPINLLAAMAMPGLTDAGIDALRAFHLGALIAATITHVIASALVGLLYAVILPMLPRRPLLLGGLITPLLWTMLMYGTMRLANPALDEHVNWWWFLLSQVAYGLTVGAVIARSGLIGTFQLVPLKDRMDLERSGEDSR